MKISTVALKMLLCAALVSAALPFAFSLRQAQTPPEELVNHALIYKAIYGDTKKCWYLVDTANQTVTVRRRERQNLASEWHEQEQVLSTAFFVVDVRNGCPVENELRTLYVAGLYPSGEACVEKWTFTTKLVSLPYKPIDQRPLPTVKRVELLRSSQFGRIRCLEPDPEGRCVLFLTLDNPTLYRIPTPQGGPIGAPVVQLMSSSIPQLASSRQILARRHSTEGRQFHLLESSRWEAVVNSAETVIIVPDADNDGMPEAAQAISMAEWATRGYTMPGPWVSCCQ